MVLICLLPYETPKEQGIVAEAWDYLSRRFPRAELSLSEERGLNLERSVREDTPVHYRDAYFEVSSADPRDDASCLEEQAKLLDFLNERYAALGLPLVSEQRLECYPLR